MIQAPFLALRTIMFASEDVSRQGLQFIRFEQLSSIGAGDLKRIAAIATNGHVMVIVRWPGELKEPEHMHRTDIERALKLGTFGDRRKTLFGIQEHYTTLGDIGQAPRRIQWMPHAGKNGYLDFPEWRRVVPDIPDGRWEVERIGVKPQYLSFPVEHLKGINSVVSPLTITVPSRDTGPIRLDINVEDDTGTHLDITYVIMPVML